MDLVWETMNESVCTRDCQSESKIQQSQQQRKPTSESSNQQHNQNKKRQQHSQDQQTGKQQDNAHSEPSYNFPKLAPKLESKTNTTESLLKTRIRYARKQLKR